MTGSTADRFSKSEEGTNTVNENYLRRQVTVE